MDILNSLFETFRLKADVFSNALICGNWQIDTSGTKSAAFHIVTHGQCDLAIGKNIKPEGLLEAGDFVFFPSDLEHRVGNRISDKHPLNDAEFNRFTKELMGKGTGLLCGNLIFEHSVKDNLFNLLPDYIVVNRSNSEMYQELQPIIQAIINESTSEQSGHQVTLNRLCEVLFTILIRNYIESDSRTTGIVAALKDERIQKTLSAIHNDPTKPWSVSELSKIAAMSESGYSNRFSELMEISPIAYLKNWQMITAYRWLRDDNISIKEAAHRLGYKRVEAFSKAFKKEIGISPGIARTQIS